MTYILLILGLGLILSGAHVFTEASSALARRFHISDFIIGLTVVAIGTSMPEFMVSLIAAIKGNGAMAIGNVVGSNIFNSLGIIGLTALVAPIALTRSNVRKDIPIGVASAALLLVITLIAIYSGSLVIGRIAGIVLVSLFVLFILYTISEGKKSKHSSAVSEEQGTQTKNKPIWLVITMALVGLVMLVAGGDFFLDSATAIAKQLNISDAVIAITIMSAGTSLPELATCIAAAIKGKGDMALGNVVGSNISNILLVIGASATATPLSFGDITLYDICFVVITSVILFVTAFTFKKKQIDRYEGVILIGIYIYYIYQLLA